MQQRTIRDILNAQINLYLVNDNPGGIASFFSKSGNEGRTRAINYQTTVINMLNGNDLFDQVWGDMNQSKGQFSSSFKLRKRLLQGLCEYKGITEEEVQACRATQLKMLSYAGSINKDFMEIVALSAALRNRLEPNRSMALNDEVELKDFTVNKKQ